MRKIHRICSWVKMKVLAPSEKTKSLFGSAFDSNTIPSLVIQNNYCGSPRSDEEHLPVVDLVEPIIPLIVTPINEDRSILEVRAVISPSF